MKLVLMTGANVGRKDDWVARHSPPRPISERKKKKIIKEMVIIIAKINANTLNCSRLRHS